MIQKICILGRIQAKQRLSEQAVGSGGKLKFLPEFKLWNSRRVTRGEEERWGLIHPFFKTEIKFLDFGKKYLEYIYL